MTTATKPILSPSDLLEHWQGQRRLTRRTIELYPAGELFSFVAVPPLRPFGAMMLEVIGMVKPTFHGLFSGDWVPALTNLEHVRTKAALLDAWDETSALLQERWSRLPQERLSDVESVYGMPAQANVNLILYLIDNEVHHRAQGFVYLRLLGVEPPAFYQR